MPDINKPVLDSSVPAVKRYTVNRLVAPFRGGAKDCADKIKIAFNDFESRINSENPDSRDAAYMLLCKELSPYAVKPKTLKDENNEVIDLYSVTIKDLGNFVTEVATKP